MVRSEERDPELVVDHVHRHLAAADRTADEGVDEEVCIVEQELVAAARGNLVEGDEGVGGDVGRVAREVRWLPGACQEEPAEPLDTRRRERVDHVRLHDDRRIDGAQPVPEYAARVVVRANGRDLVDGPAGRRAGAHHAKERTLRQAVEHEVRDEPVLVQIARDDALFQ